MAERQNVRQFSQDQLQAIADALGDTSEGLTGSEISHLLASCEIADIDSANTKRHRLYNAFVNDQNTRKDRKHIIGFIRKTMKPARFAREQHRFEPMRANLNRALAFAGIQVDATGTLISTTAASTLSEAQRRANELRSDLRARGVHADVLEFCKEELLADNYFHAVLEAVKSIADKIRNRTGLTDDGAVLIDRAFAGSPPMLAINPLVTKSEQDEQKGFTNLVKGTFGMFRNPLAHEARINWTMSKEDAEDILSVVSLVHRRLDAAQMPARV